MSENGSNQKHTVSREDWLKRIRENDHSSNGPYEDPFSEHLLNSLKYISSESDVRGSLNRLDKRRRKSSSPDTSYLMTLVRQSPSWLNIAAVFLLILIPTLLMISKSHDQHSRRDQLYALYFQPEASAVPGTGTLREVPLPGTDSDLKQSALNFYEAKKYESAIPLFRKVLKESPSDPDASFYLSISLMQAEQYKPAIDLLKKIRSDTTAKKYNTAAGWYLALAYLKLGDPTETIQRLRQLSKQDDSPYYQKKAAALLDLLAN